METVVAPVRNRTSWGAIFAGVFVALGTQLLLVMLGLAIGLGAIDPQSQNPFSGIGMGSVIWLFLSAIVSLFAGGYVAGRLAAVASRGDGGLNGAVVWALILVLSVFITGQGLAGIVGGVTSVVQQGASAASSGADQGLIEDLLRSSGLTEEPEVQTTEVPGQEAEQPAPPSEEGLTQDDAAKILSENTGLSEQEAQALLERGERAAGDVDIAAGARTAGEAVATYSSAAMWGAFLLFSFMLLAGIAGGAVGVKSQRRERVSV